MVVPVRSWRRWQPVQALDETYASDALLLGRKTYEGFAAAWPEREGPFADKFNSMPKYVVSTTLGEATWNNSTLIKDDIPGEVAKLKETLTGIIMINGSRQLIHTLLEHDLVDEYHLMVFPIVLGHGNRLFEEGSARSVLKLTDTTPVGPDGVVVLTYRRAESSDSD